VKDFTFSSKYSGIPFYRTRIHSHLVGSRVVYKQSDLFVLAERDLSDEVLRTLIEVRRPLETYILKNPFFLKSFVPLPDDLEAPELVRKMLYAGRMAGVGPMASVAGAIAEAVGKRLLERGLTKEVVVENGGDIFLSLKKEGRVSLFAGDSPFSGKVALVIPPELQPCGVCTSSGKIGHSLSFGKADAITVIHKDTAVADALATAFGNMLKAEEDFKKIIARAERIEGLLGVFAILKDKLFAFSTKIRIEPF